MKNKIILQTGAVVLISYDRGVQKPCHLGAQTILEST